MRNIKARDNNLWKKSSSA